MICQYTSSKGQKAIYWKNPTVERQDIRWKKDTNGMKNKFHES